jgi:RNA polymerase primary sigma factor
MSKMALRNQTLSLYLNDLKKTHPLGREEEGQLARKASMGDARAKAKLIEANLRFVVLIAKKYRNQGLPLEDLINEGNIGLMKAVERFEPDRGYRFLSYAVWWIRQSILKALYEQSRMIRLPAHTISELREMEKQREQYRKTYGMKPDLAELARIMHVDEAYLEELINFSQNIASLEAPIESDEGSSELGDLLADKASAETDEATMSESLKNELSTVLQRLSPREAGILCDRFGLNGHRPKTLAEISDEMHIAKERVRQLEKRAIRKLRHSTNVRHLRSYLS